MIGKHIARIRAAPSTDIGISNGSILVLYIIGKVRMLYKYQFCVVYLYSISMQQLLLNDNI